MVKSIHITTLVGLLLLAPLLNAKDIVHDAEHYILLEQHGKQWAAEDKQIDAKLAEIQKQNGGKRPNIFYILVDDVGFGEMGSEQLNRVRGYRTPNINKLATVFIGVQRHEAHGEVYFHCVCACLPGTMDDPESFTQLHAAHTPIKTVAIKNPSTIHPPNVSATHPRPKHFVVKRDFCCVLQSKIPHESVFREAA